MNDEDLLRYQRHVLLDGIDIEGQGVLCASRVLLIGAGGLGCPAALYLAAAGVGHLTVVDDDTVELGNLQRQVAYAEADLGRPKVCVLAERARGLNRGVRVHPVMERADEDLLEHLVVDHDVVLDTSDNFATRHAVNRVCRALDRPLVSAAAIRWEGQVSVFDFRLPGVPCYACLYPPDGEENLSCAEAGVYAPLCGVVGSLQAGEALKVLLCREGTLCGRLLVADLRRVEIRTLRLSRDPGCPVCSENGAT